MALYTIVPGLAYAVITALSLWPVDGGTTNLRGHTVGGDFMAFYTAAFQVVHGLVDSVYDPDRFRVIKAVVTGDSVHELPFFYPPWSLFIWAPLGFSGFTCALLTWTGLQLVVLGWLAYRITGLGLAPLLVLVCPPVLRAAITGQTGMLMAIFLAGGFLLLRHRSRGAGAVLGLMVVKPHLAITLPFILAGGRQWWAFVLTGLTAVGIAGLGLLVFGWGAMEGFLALAADHGDKTLLSSNDRWDRLVSPLAAMLRLTSSTTAAWAVHIIVAVGALGVAAWVWWRTEDPAARAMAGVVAIPLVNPYMFAYDLAVFLVPIAFLGKDLIAGKLDSWDSAALVAMWLVPFVSFVAGVIGFQPAPLVFLALLAVAWRRAIRRAPVSPAATPR
ncbi:MAG: glycosyltransferase family 87 protein [Magnetospiraceae bacterium]